LNTELKSIGFNDNITYINEDNILTINNYISDLKTENKEKYYSNTFKIKFINSILNSYNDFKYINETITFENENFYNYKDWVGNESQTIFIDKINLYYPFLNNNFENIIFYDTQGSDSIYIRHGRELNQFLNHSDIILYIISSRYCLREADFKLINKIISMNPNSKIYFLLNVFLDDFNNLTEITKILESIKFNLKDFVSEPIIFPFSALYIISNNIDDLTFYEKERLNFWEQKNDIISFLNNSYIDLTKSLENKSKNDNEFSNELISNKINTIIKYLKNSIEFLIDILNNKTNNEINHKKYFKIAGSKFNTLKSSLIGIEKELIKNYFSEIDDFFDNSSGKIYQTIENKLNNYFPEKYPYYKELNSITDINHIYNLFFNNISKKFNDIINTEIHNNGYDKIKKIHTKIKNIYDSKFNEIDDEINDIFNSVFKSFKKIAFNKINPIFLFNENDFSFNKFEIKHPIFNQDFISIIPNINTSVYLKYCFNYSLLNAKKVFNKLTNKKNINIDISIAKKIVNKIEQDAKSYFLKKTKFELTNFKENIKYQYIKYIIQFYNNALIDALEIKEKFLLDSVLQYFNVDTNILNDEKKMKKLKKILELAD
jgi:hypothetical protein